MDGIITQENLEKSTMMFTIKVGEEYDEKFN